MNQRRLEDAFAPVPDVVQEHIDQGLAEVHEMNGKHRKPLLATLLAAALVLALAGTAVAAGLQWGVFDFLARGQQTDTVLPGARDAVQTALSQEGGVTDTAVFTLKEGLSDGQFAWLVFEVTPTEEDTLLIVGEVGPSSPASELSSELPEDITLAAWAEQSGYARMVQVQLDHRSEEQYNVEGFEVGQTRCHWASGAVTIMQMGEYSETMYFVGSATLKWDSDSGELSSQATKRSRQAAAVSVALGQGTEPLWTAEWSGEMPVDETNVTLEHVKLIGTLMGTYVDIVYRNWDGQEPDLSYFLHMEPVDEQGNKLRWAAGNSYGSISTVVIEDDWTFGESYDIRFVSSYAAMEQPPETLWLSFTVEKLPEWAVEQRAAGQLRSISVSELEIVRLPLVGIPLSQ